MSDVDQPTKPVRVSQDEDGTLRAIGDDDITSDNGENCSYQAEPGPLRAGLNAIFASLFDDEFYLDRYNSFKSASAGFLLLTLFTQNCTQLRLLVLAKNRDDYVEHVGLWRALIFFMSVVVVLLIICAVMLFIISLLPLANIQNQRVLVRLNTILTVAIALTCMLNVLASTLIFAESKESFYQPQPANPIDDE